MIRLFFVLKKFNFVFMGNNARKDFRISDFSYFKTHIIPYIYILR